MIALSNFLSQSGRECLPNVINGNENGCKEIERDCKCDDCHKTFHIPDSCVTVIQNGHFKMFGT